MGIDTLSATESYSPRKANFFEEQRPRLEKLFTALGRESLWSPDLPELLPYTQARWMGREHGLTSEKDRYEPHQEVAAWPLLEEMNLLNEVLPPKGTQVGQIIIAGGLMRANHERLRFTKRLLDENIISTDGPVIFWAGQRHRYDDEATTTEDLFNARGRYPGFDDSANQWVERQRSLPWQAGDVWTRSIATETETARLAISRIFGGTLLTHQIDLEAVPVHRPADIPPRLVAGYHYQPEGYPEIIVVNGRAVERSDGAPRPTTVSCAEESLERYPPPEGTNVLFISGNPHTRRTLDDVQSILDSKGRHDISLVPAGPAARPDASIQLVLGEVARLLYISAKEDTDPASLQLHGSGL